mgnify:CR=1 FL=1
MTSKNKKKDFDCLENKWKAAEAIYNETKNLGNEELIEYYRKSAKDGPFADWWESIKEKKKLHLVSKP